ncbi:hypothetical protein Tco_1444929 [Tanacetum coccineum]
MGTVKLVAAGSSYVPRKELSMGSWDINSKTLHEIREMDYPHMFMEFNVGTARQACLNTELLLKETKATEAVYLRAQVSAAEATEKMHAGEIDALKQKNVALENEKGSFDGKVKDGLVDQVSGYERLKEQIEEFQDTQMNAVNEKVAKQDTDLLEMACLLEENFYPHILTTISRRSHAIEQGMQSGLAADIDHGKEGRGLTDVAAYNPDAEADFNSALQKFCEVDFPLLAELKSHKDASVEDVMNLLRLEAPLTDAPGMSNLQPNVEQLRVPIHRENIAAQRLALIGVWNPLSEPLSIQNLMGMASISDSVPVSAVTTTALSTTFASASFIPPITI